jgi:hypothetical protein
VADTPRAVDPILDNPFNPRPKVGDFFAPFFTIRFLAQGAPQGTKVDAKSGAETTVEIGEGDSLITSDSRGTVIAFTQDGKTKQFRSYATSLTIKNKGGAASEVELRLEPPFDDAVVLIDQRAVQRDAVLVVEWGWSSNDSQETVISDKHYFMTMPPKMEVSGTDVSITITAWDIFAVSSLRRETRMVYPRIVQIWSTDLGILEFLAAKNNMRINTTAAPAGSPIRKVRPINSLESASVEQNEKDWIFFKRLCDVNKCDFFTIGQTVFIVDLNYASKVLKTSFRLVFWNQLSQVNDIPIYGFSVDEVLPTLFGPAEGRQLTAKHADEDAQQTVTTTLDPLKTADLAMIGLRSSSGAASMTGRTVRISDDVQIIPMPAYTKDESGKVMSTPSGTPNRDEKVSRISQDAHSLCNTNLKVTIPGVPRMVPMQLVRVVGISSVFSGVYQVLEVVHKLTTGGYDCEISLVRGSSTGDTEAGVGDVPAAGSTDPDSDTGQGVPPKDADES